MAVVETCQRFSPADHLLRWLAYFDKCRAYEAAAKLAEALDAGAGDDELVQLTAETEWRKHRISQVSDAKYLRTLISDATKVSVDLVQAGVVTKRGRYKEVEHRLQVPNVDEGVRADLAGEILLWLEGGKTKGAVKRVMGMLGFDRSKLAADGLGFSNTTIHIAGAQPVSVTPDTVRDLFTYPLPGSLRRDEVQWEQDTRPKVIELAAIEQIDLAV